MSSRFRSHLARARGVPVPDPRPPTELPPGLGVPAIRALGPSLGDRDEAEVCDAVAAWLRSGGWEVFFEVPLGEGRPDIVGVRAIETLAIEAKLEDVASVVKQGLRAAHFVGLAYVALPAAAAAEATVPLARIARDRPHTTRPGVLAVGRTVTELLAPAGRPRQPITPEELRRLGLVAGAVRGGVAGGDAYDRDARLYLALHGGLEVGRVAREARLDPGTVRRVILRMLAAREHLTRDCRADCDNDTVARLAHRRSDELRALPSLSPLLVERLARGR